MAKPYKSLWKDFLMFIGVLPTGRPRKLNKRKLIYSRHGYPQEYLESFTEEEEAEIKRESELMSSMFQDM